MEETTTKSIIIAAEPQQLFEVCADIESLPRHLKHIRSVGKTGENVSHWVVEGPGGEKLEWDAELTRLEPGKRIAWHTTENGDIKTSGQITFNSLPHNQTELTLTLKVVGPGGEHKLPESAERLVEENLRAFKTSIEESRA